MSATENMREGYVVFQDRFLANDPTVLSLRHNHFAPDQAKFNKPTEVGISTPPTHLQAKHLPSLDGEIIAILATDGFDQSDLFESKRALEEAGAKIEVISPKAGCITGSDRGKWDIQLAVDVALELADPNRYDGLLLPDGAVNIAQLRADEEVAAFVRSLVELDKPVGAICHAPSVLIDARVLDGRKITSWPSLMIDIRNAGGDWVDQPVVVDRGFITSQQPRDLPAFNQALIKELNSQRRGRVKIGPTDV